MQRSLLASNLPCAAKKRTWRAWQCNETVIRHHPLRALNVLPSDLRPQRQHRFDDADARWIVCAASQSALLVSAQGNRQLVQNRPLQSKFDELRETKASLRSEADQRNCVENDAVSSESAGANQAHMDRVTVGRYVNLEARAESLGPPPHTRLRVFASDHHLGEEQAIHAQ